jgi:hypothetical protein
MTVLALRAAAARRGAHEGAAAPGGGPLPANKKHAMSCPVPQLPTFAYKYKV